MSDGGRARLDQCVDTIESGYEYFLAYAAQGRRTDRDQGAVTSELRDHLEKMIGALGELDAVVRECAAQSSDVLESSAAFFDAVAEDAARAAAVLRLTLAREAISSQLIDNLNASIHVRALLTDLFIVDEALR